MMPTTNRIQYHEYGGPEVMHLEEVSRAAAEGALDLPVARTVPLAQAMDALTELERQHTPKGGKLVITPVS